MDRFRDPGVLASILGDWMTHEPVLYRALARAIRNAVEAGDLAPGDRLPSERDLADALHVSRSTAVAAYDELRALGLLNSRPGSGTVVAGPDRATSSRSRRIHRGPAAPIVQRMGVDSDLISMKYALETGDPLVRELTEAVIRDDLDDLLGQIGYSPGGLPSLRSAIAERLAAEGLPSDPDQVLITGGTQQAIALLAQLLLERDALVAVESPSWPGCFDAFSALGARIAPVEMDDQGLRVDRLRNLLDREAVGMIFTMPTFHNPTGSIMSPARRRDLARLVGERGVPLVEDYAYSTLVGHEGPVPAPIAASTEPRASVFTVGSLSKVAWAGLRIGWIRGDRAAIGRLAYLKANADMGAPLLEQAVAARLIPRIPELQSRRTEAAHARLAHLSHLLAEFLPEWRWHEPAGGTALWVALPGADTAVFASVALRHGVEVVAGRATDPTGRWDSHIRLPFTYEPDTMTLAIRRLADAWADYRPAAPR